MYELLVALKYLVPKKRILSASVISFIAFIVISLVVWLALIFLSVTTGLEQNWLNKLTSVNAPLRITPTDHYYSSYYYLIDSLSADSFYETKTIQEKAVSTSINPYSPEEDREIPLHWPAPHLDEKGNFKDPVKKAFHHLDDLKKDFPKLTFQDYEISGALLRLSLQRTEENTFQTKTSFLSQMTYLLTFPNENPHLKDLIISPSTEDINHLLLYPDTSMHHTLNDKSYLSNPFSEINDHVLQNIVLEKIVTEQNFHLPFALLPEGRPLNVKFASIGKSYAHLILSSDKAAPFSKQIMRENQKLKIFDEENIIEMDPKSATINMQIENPLTLDVKEQKEILSIQGLFQGHPIKGKIPFMNVHIAKAIPKIYFESEPTITPLWAYFVKGKGWQLPTSQDSYGILLPKSYQKNKVLLGDNGYFAYNSATGGSSQEQRLSFYVAGFYDPGVFPLGNRFIMAPYEIVRAINSSSFVSTSEISSNGIFVWNTPLQDAKKMKVALLEKFEKDGIASYWNIDTYEDYEFSKDLLQQFQSDKLLFTLVAVIILLVACSNIISMLVLLVNDKKKEIAILLSMGATRKSIAAIFGFCGFITGLLSSVTGIVCAIITLKNIDKVTSFLSMVQGHQAFNTIFFGDNLPNALSQEALYFILIITPLISFLAGMIPAIKAAKLHPSKILRS